MALKEIKNENSPEGVPVEWKDEETGQLRLYIEQSGNSWRIIEISSIGVPMVYKGKFFITSEAAIRYTKSFHPLLHKFVPSVPDGRACLMCGWDEHRHLLKGYE